MLGRLEVLRVLVFGSFRPIARMNTRTPHEVVIGGLLQKAWGPPSFCRELFLGSLLRLLRWDCGVQGFGALSFDVV